MLASFPKMPNTQRPKPWKHVFDYPTVVWRPPFHGTPANIRINLILSESRVIVLYPRRWKYGSVFIQIFVVGSEMRTCLETVRNGPSRSSKVIDFGTNRKRVFAFLLVINSNLGRILPSFRDIAGFLLRRETPPTFHPNFGVFRLD